MDGDRELLEMAAKAEQAEASLSEQVQALDEALAKAERDLGMIADYIEPHWRGAGLPLSAEWMLREMETRSARLEDAREQAEQAERERDETMLRLANQDDEVIALQRELAEARQDAERWDWFRSKTRGERSVDGRGQFVQPRISPITGIMMGSIAEHLDAAIDAARKTT